MNIIFLVWLIADLASYSRSGPLRFSSSNQFRSLSIAPCDRDLSVKGAETNYEAYQYKTPNETMSQILPESSRLPDSSGQGMKESIFQRVNKYGELQSSPIGSRSSREKGTEELGDTNDASSEIFINLRGEINDVDRYLDRMRHPPYSTEIRQNKKVSSTSKTRVLKRTLQPRRLVQTKNKLTQDPILNNKTVSVVSSVQEAVRTIESSMNRFDEIAKNFINPKVSAATLKKAADEGLVIETGEGFPRQVLASATSNPEAAQRALAVIRDEVPKIIAKIVLANKNLIGGIVGGDKKLISTRLFSPSLTAIGNKLNLEQRTAVDQSKKELDAKTRSIDTQMLILQNQASTPKRLKVAATSALALEAEQIFHREVLVSAASDSKAAVSALLEVAENGPKCETCKKTYQSLYHYSSGLINIIRNSDDETKVKTSLQSIIEGHTKVVAATLKLIQLTSNSSTNLVATEKEFKKANVTLDKTPLLDSKTHDNHVEVVNQDDKTNQKESKPVTAQNHQHSIPIQDNNLSQPANATSKDLVHLLDSELTELISNGTSTKAHSSVLTIPKSA
ncbi:uncharacterized protein MELLADRAFT_110661 [Melampsora larici-populina 98AG31]|uniref:Secreted protein n=1 Tax=Melampsora larici-populina (strain 98AG31 / pathotype 3-4-7) TaxID=747676 RepID=F4S0J0_MELLP|nr:uncharacterized protein MELLADRAFT_110661 [Melampsora larici-populina 98AG31]EGG01776.1 hypothetical protein MELLADRAFT_110661 [Melampsora larici-populina 98AG31]